MSFVEQYHAPDVSTQETSMQLGWEDHLYDQLLEKSSEPHVEIMTPEDAEFKFSSIKAIERWRNDRFTENDPLIVWLGTAAGELAGIAWIENAQQRTGGGNKIFGVRVYDGFEDHGNGTRLTLKVHELFDKRLPGVASQFAMRTINNKAFSIGIGAGYRLGDAGSNMDTQICIRKR